MKRQDFSEYSSVMIIVSLVVLSLLANYFYGKAGRPEPNNRLRFPAYETTENIPRAHRVNSAMPFCVTADFPEQWSLTTEAGDCDWPEGELYSPYYLYDGDTPVAMAGFNVYDGTIETIDNDASHKIALQPLYDDHKSQWGQFTPVLNGFTNQIGTMTAESGQVSYPAVVIFDIKLNSYAVICFMPGVIDDQQLLEFAKTVRIAAQ